MTDLMSISELARQLNVQISTVTRWGTLEDAPLRIVGEGRRRRIAWADYEAFASRHVGLRGVKKQVRQGPRRADEASVAAPRDTLVATLRDLERMRVRTQEALDVATAVHESLSMLVGLSEHGAKPSGDTAGHLP